MQVFKTDVEFELLFELTTKLLDVFMANPELQLLLTSYCHTRCLRATELDRQHEDDYTEATAAVVTSEVKDEAAPRTSVYRDVLRLVVHSTFTRDDFKLDFTQAMHKLALPSYLFSVLRCIGDSLVP